MNRRYVPILVCTLFIVITSACRRTEADVPKNIVIPMTKHTMLLDVDQHHKPVLSIEGWQEYHKGDVISAQQDGTVRDYEIIGGFFIVEPSSNGNSSWQPHAMKTYHVKAL